MRSLAIEYELDPQTLERTGRVRVRQFVGTRRRDPFAIGSPREFRFPPDPRKCASGDDS